MKFLMTTLLGMLVSTQVFATEITPERLIGRYTAEARVLFQKVHLRLRVLTTKQFQVQRVFSNGNVGEICDGTFTMTPMALWFGFTKAVTARRFSLAMGALYGALGLLGFILGTPGLPTAGPIRQERFLWKPELTTLEMGTIDHTLHLVFAGIFVLGALLRFKSYQKI